MTHIPIHRLSERAGIGVEIRHTSDGGKYIEEARHLGVHRDDHYIFFMLDEGHGSLMVDFEEVVLKRRSVYYMLPGQVHHKIDNSHIEGWFLAVDTLLVPKDYRIVFENQLVLQQPYNLDNMHYKQCSSLLKLIHDHYNHNTESTFYKDIMHSMLNSFIGMVACGYEALNESGKKQTRPAQIVQEFKCILNDNFKTEKRPSAYAGMLNISESYLNEALKNTTGLPVSYWVINEVMLEAKRLLYYSALNVKQIAHEVGYEDHTYFSRLFKKTTGVTPLAFKATYRK